MPRTNLTSAVLLALRHACEAHPSQRTMQVLVNACGPDPFYMEDREAVQRLLEYAAQVNKP